MTAYVKDTPSSIGVCDFGIHDKFRKLLPPLPDLEQSGLLESIRLGGVSDPLIVWFDGVDWWLVDGHNRYFAWMRAQDDNQSLTEPDVRELVAETEHDVQIWIIEKHLNRRNLTPNQLSEFRGRVYNNLKKDSNNNLKTPMGQRDPSVKTSEKRTSAELAERYGVSEKTVRRDGDYAKGLDILDEENPVAAEASRSGKPHVNKSDVEEIGRKGTTKSDPPKPKLDPSKREIPADMADVFDECRHFNSILNDLSDVLRYAKERKDQQGWEHFRWQYFESAIQKAKEELKFAKPHTTCVDEIHQGPDCKLCRGVRFLVRDTMGRLSDLGKAALPEVVE